MKHPFDYTAGMDNKVKKSVVTAYRYWNKMIVKYGPAIKNILIEVDKYALEHGGVLPDELKRFGFFSGKDYTGVVTHRLRFPFNSTLDDCIYLVFTSRGEYGLGMGNGEHEWNTLPADNRYLYFSLLDFAGKRGMAGKYIDGVLTVGCDPEEVSEHLEKLTYMLYGEACAAKHWLDDRAAGRL